MSTLKILSRKSSVFISVLFLSGAAFAQMQYISQNRSVSASNDKGLSNSASAAGFGLFSDLASVSWGGYQATAEQYSWMMAEQITAIGSTLDTGPFYAIQSFHQNAHSDFELQFETDVPYRCVLGGYLDAYGDYGGYGTGDYEARLTLADELGSILYSNAMTGGQGFEGEPTVELNEVIGLSPGRYTLSISAFSEGGYGGTPEDPLGGGGGWADYNIECLLFPAVSYVDDNAPGDPGPNNPAVSDPYEDGTADHPYDTIQEAINDAWEGETVIVLTGTYRENILLYGKNLHLTNTNPDSWTTVENTIIDGRHLGSVVTFAGTENTSCTLSGFKIINGSGLSGCGIEGNGAEAGISRCIISGSGGTDTMEGAGIANCHGTIDDCTIQQNCSGLNGGGLYNCDGFIINCRIENNEARYGGGGGLRDCDGAIRGCEILNNKGQGLLYCAAVISDCRIEGNYTSSEVFAGGGGLYGCGNYITRCVIRNNRADGAGGGLYDCSGSITHCVIAGNQAGTHLNPKFGGRGGGLAYCDGIISYCTIVGNSALTNGSGTDGGLGGGLFNCSGVITNSIVWDNDAEAAGDQLHSCVTPTYSCIQSWTGGGVGNFNLNPLFANLPGGDYHLRSQYGRWQPGSQSWVHDAVTSPCIDAGDPAECSWAQELWPHGKRVNMGAWGGTREASMSPSEAGNAADFTFDDCVNMEDLSAFTERWLACEAFLMEDTDRDGCVSISDFAVLAANWRICISQGMVGRWPLNETSGTQAWDASGFENHGTLYNGPLWTGTGALRFDGINDWVRVPDSTSLDLTGALSISLWIYMDQYSTNWSKLMIKPYNTADTDPWELYCLDLGHWGTYPRFILSDGIPGGARLSASNSSIMLSLGQWHHIAGTYSGTTIALYVNGQPVAQNAGSISIGTNSQPLSIGGRLGTHSFNGIIDEVRIYNRALSAAEVLNLYQETRQ